MIVKNKRDALCLRKINEKLKFKKIYIFFKNQRLLNIFRNIKPLKYIVIIYINTLLTGFNIEI